MPLNRPMIRLGLNRVEVGLALGVSAASVDAMVADGFLPPPKRWRKRKIWMVSEIEAAMSEWPTDEAGRSIPPEDDDEDWTTVT